MAHGVHPGQRPLDHVGVAHVPVHSPDGFETGYLGSGPADLALAIACHHLDLIGEKWEDGEQLAAEFRHHMTEGTERLAWRMHQPIKIELIAPRQIARGQSYEIAWEDVATFARLADDE